MCLQMNVTSLENAGVCESTLDELTAVLTTRAKYSGHPVLDSDVQQLVSIISRLIDDCPARRHGDDLSSLFSVADLIFGHSAAVGPSRAFYRSYSLQGRFKGDRAWVEPIGLGF